jgi:hypothetical protein
MLPTEVDSVFISLTTRWKWIKFQSLGPSSCERSSRLEGRPSLDNGVSALEPERLEGFSTCGEATYAAFFPFSGALEEAAARA